MIARGLPRAAGVLRHSCRLPGKCPTVGILAQRGFTTPTKPLNATEVTIDRDALLSPSARIVVLWNASNF